MFLDLDPPRFQDLRVQVLRMTFVSWPESRWPDDLKSCGSGICRVWIMPKIWDLWSPRAANVAFYLPWFLTFLMLHKFWGLTQPLLNEELNIETYAWVAQFLMYLASFFTPVVLIAWPKDSLLTFRLVAVGNVHVRLCVSFWFPRLRKSGRSTLSSFTHKMKCKTVQTFRWLCFWCHKTYPWKQTPDWSIILHTSHPKISRQQYSSSSWTEVIQQTTIHTHTNTIFLRHRSSSVGPKEHKLKYIPKFCCRTQKCTHVTCIHSTREFLQRRKYSLPLWASSRSCALGHLLLPHRPFYFLRTLSF